jgi:hypothetical protein
MAKLQIRIPNNQIIRVAQSQGYGIDDLGVNPLTEDGAEQFLLKKIKNFLMSSLKMAETRDAVRIAKEQADAAIDAEDVIKAERILV